MRRLIGTLVVVAVIVAGLAVADIWVRHKVQAVVATHIEQEFPGSTATVKISSFPFVGRLATSGKVPKLTVDAEGITAGGFTFDAVDLVADDLKVDTSRLASGHVVLESLSSGTVTADLTQASIDQRTGTAITLGAGTAELAGITVRPAVSISGSTVTFAVAGLPRLLIPVPPLSIPPCIGAATIVPGALQLSCRLTSLPPVLDNFSVAF